MAKVQHLIWITILLAGCATGESIGQTTQTQTPHTTIQATGRKTEPVQQTQLPEKTIQPTSGATRQAENSPAPANTTTTPAASVPPKTNLAKARDKIKHIVIIMQENRSFDTYFGTFPGVDGIPMVNGTPTVCVPEPQQSTCVEPFHNSKDINSGGPHKADSAITDIDGGKMDGFVAVLRDAQSGCKNPYTPGCNLNEKPDVKGWHDAREIPNYWAYAENFVLQDRMFEPNASWSLPSHLFMVSGWSADCPVPADPSSCANALDGPGAGDGSYAWTDLTYLLNKGNVAWAYYLSEGNQADCADNSMLCKTAKQSRDVSSIMNPLPGFETVKQDGQLGNIQTVDKFYTAAKDGTLPQSSWIVPDDKVSEHPPSRISDGQTYVTGLINAIMQGPEWESTAIFLAWDDWGGFYDHVVPPTIDENGYGLRVPGLVISAYAKKGFIDHQTLSFDAYLKFIEDIFLGGQRLEPANDGRPDSRPTVRENAPQLGDLILDFDFNQTPRDPLILSVNPPPGSASLP